MTRRSAVTLTEVLVAIFIMSIGLMALLTLFPLGAIQMGQAIKDDRCGNAAYNAHATIQLLWRLWINDTTGHPKPFFTGPILAAPGDFVHPSLEGSGSWLWAMQNPNLLVPPFAPVIIGIPIATPAPATYPNGTPVHPPIPVDRNRGSYPIYLDPIGSSAYQAVGDLNRKYWVGGRRNTGGIPRRSLLDPADPSYYALPPALVSNIIHRLCCTIDDLSFSENGLTFDPLTGQTIERGYRYNWAWMLRRLPGDDFHKVQMTVVVYNRRPTTLPAEKDEKWYRTLWIEGQPRAYVDYSANGVSDGTRPAIRKDGWLLDCSVFRNQAGVETWVNSDFYRVININDLGTNMLELELATPVRRGRPLASLPPAVQAGDPVAVRGYLNSPPNPILANDLASVYLDGVAEVFERGSLSLDPKPVP